MKTVIQQYRFYLACFQLTPSHATVFYAVRKYTKSSKIDKEEYRVFMDFNKFKVGIPYIIDSMGMCDIVDGFTEEAVSRKDGGTVVSSQVNSIEDVLINLDEACDERERALTVEEIMKDEAFDNNMYVTEEQLSVNVTDDTEVLEFKLYERSKDKVVFSCC